uniref:Uncharacterized protein n=1 Tax=Utricularia reniformis TaxID=192314 RepID=A0A1Y0B464_9LAMI|nr:hypothetical protein AEK19_MT2091 [Utricularia reniformis]ART32245.1 hypothetical protein AEK19_MT2091 [Utricularia reniformis]
MEPSQNRVEERSPRYALVEQKVTSPGSYCTAFSPFVMLRIRPHVLLLRYCGR